MPLILSSSAAFLIRSSVSSNPGILVVLNILVELNAKGAAGLLSGILLSKVKCSTEFGSIITSFLEANDTIEATNIDSRKNSITKVTIKPAIEASMNLKNCFMEFI